MRLALKFSLSFVASLCLVLAVYAFLLSEQEIDRLRLDSERDQQVLAHALALGVRQEWATAGEQAALDFIRQANLSQARNVAIGWNSLSQAPPRGLPSEKWTELKGDREIVWIDPSEPPGHLVTFTPVRGPDGHLGALEIRESLEDEVYHSRRVMRNTVLAAASVAALSAVLSAILGMRLVGRPVSRLIEQTREVASGHFERRLDFHQRDELGELAGELNKMCEQLETARERLARETDARIRTLDQLRHADRLKTVGQLASGIAHELGTPLNVVRARAKMIASREDCDPQARTNAQIAVEQSDRMIAIIRQLLDFARPRAPRRIVTDLMPIVEKTADLLRTMADKKGVVIHVAASPEGACVAEVDPDQIQQVLSNLMLNGIQAMSQGGELSVFIAEAHAGAAGPGGEGGAYCRIDVQDRGEGIQPEHLQRIFEPFFTTKQAGEGTGLGLSVSRGIIGEHGGWISATSTPGEGSCFSIYLPRRTSDVSNHPDRG